MKNLNKLRMFFSLSWEISPSYIIFLILSTLISSGQIFINVILPKYLIDELMGSKDFERLIILGSLIILSNLLFALLNNTMKRIMEVKNIYMNEMMNKAMADKIMNVEFSYLENPYYLDLKERAAFAANNQAAMERLIRDVASMLKNIVTILGLVTIMFTLSWILIILLSVVIIVSILAYRLFMNYQMNFFQEIIPVNRRYGYYVNLCYDDKLQKDIRLYDMSDMMTDKVTHYNLEINEWFSRYYKKQGKFLGLYGVLNDLQGALAYGYVGLRVITDKLGPRIGLGSFTMYVNAAINFTKATTELGNNIVNVIQLLGYLDPFMEFMSLPDEGQIGGNVVFDGDVESIEFKNVSFKYPKSDRLVLDNVSFKINKGEKISIVGLNGAGKTTLVKLICRLYRPTEGKILINGRDIFEYEHESYMKRIAAVFQDYKLFNFSIEENITGKELNEDSKKALNLIEEVGLKDRVESLPDGIKSLLGKAYDERGVELSGGEQQKIAIARALYKNSSLVILDEPTSALDPIAEAEIYENFNNLVGDKTAFYISHRMSSSVFCDKILVIDGGEVKDFDTHENLMKKEDSLYYKLYNAQAVNYQYN
ncbi:ABC transporter ATP-binding protein [Tepidimicrobium xylanilyticum]|uniref:ATP-binding cassette, subfamily C n=1 Tax=Tepidimicrobium xylanilyticum TaxID=1123352 RepID=A0A1H2TCW3_9FIRM|nr:ABC transporter ATP-binding protein [Tepidimicrobium xylanilyticum]GMG95977.1 ABC transporter ATP-binding protein [Tepidimicrobium xylanilyticum]SDW41535.1 ATP-binding cassette, subfamily C [Tepidimicrobium xylanilyticum]